MLQCTWGLVDGVFRSVDAGKSWTSLNDENLADKKIQAITAIGDTVFVGTDKGLYRHSSEGWAQISVGETENIRALASAEHRLYVAVGNDAQNKTFSMTSQFFQHLRPLCRFKKPINRPRKFVAGNRFHKNRFRFRGKRLV